MHPTVADWPTDDPLTDDAIAGTYRLYQRKNGHRFSLDDVATAWEAASTVTRASRYIDIGCGIGSVLHMVAWKLRDAQVVGIEAQPISFDLATRNIVRNGLSERVRLIHGDLRDTHVIEEALEGGKFELVTGTPPYVPPGDSTPSPDSQRAHARVELRGGIEDYLATAARLVAPNGRIVACCDARTPERPLRGAKNAGLVALRRRDVMPRVNALHALFAVWTFARAEDVPGAELETMEPLLIRDDKGERTAAANSMRDFFEITPIAAKQG